MNTIRHEAPPPAYCHYSVCAKPVFELEPGLPTLFCAEHRALAVAESNRIRANNRKKAK
jgi:hypothetical protein